MKTLGLLGGMSWESTRTYYDLLNRGARERGEALDGDPSHSARLVLHSVDFAEIAALQHSGDWATLTQLLSEAAKGLARAGAEALLVCTNTMHLVADALTEASGLPLIHIVDPTASAIQAADCKRPLLLATKFTMEGAFYTDRYRDKFGLELLVPGSAARAEVHRVIYEELIRGDIRDSSRASYLEIIAEAVEQEKIDSVIFGCTEIGLLLSEADLLPGLKGFDTTALHCSAALDWAFERS